MPPKEDQGKRVIYLSHTWDFVFVVVLSLFIPSYLFIYPTQRHCLWAPGLDSGVKTLGQIFTSCTCQWRYMLPCCRCCLEFARTFSPGWKPKIWLLWLDPATMPFMHHALAEGVVVGESSRGVGVAKSGGWFLMFCCSGSFCLAWPLRVLVFIIFLLDVYIQIM